MIIRILLREARRNARYLAGAGEGYSKCVMPFVIKKNPLLHRNQRCSNFNFY